MKSRISILLLSCGAVALAPLSAQESVKPEVTIKPGEPVKLTDDKGEPKREKERDEKKKPERQEMKKPERDEGKKPDKEKPHKPEHGAKPAHPEKLTTYLGLMLRDVSPELAAQVGIPEGFGLLVADVAKDSPAAEAKFNTHDVIVMIGDQRVVNLPQFQALIRSQKKGDEVTLTLHRKGVSQKLSAKLGERMLPVGPSHGMGHPMMQRQHGMHPMHHPMMKHQGHRKMGDPKQHPEQRKDGQQPKRPSMEGEHGKHHPDMKHRGPPGPDAPHSPRHEDSHGKGKEGPKKGAPEGHHDERRDHSPDRPHDGDRRPENDQSPRPSKTKA